MTSNERHRLTHDRVVASLLLADTRSERHGVYCKRWAVLPVPVKRPHVWTMPRVSEKQP